MLSEGYSNELIDCFSYLFDSEQSVGKDKTYWVLRAAGVLVIRPSFPNHFVRSINPVIHA